MHRTVQCQQREAATVAANALDDFRDSTDLAKTFLELAKAAWAWPTGWPYRKFGYVGFVRLLSCLFVSGLIALSVSKLAERKRS